jgi:uncharacterized phage-associated protein
MRLPFNEAKATQAASRLLLLRGGTMSYLKLIKLLYLVDREALLRWGRPVTTDRYVSMDQGPVVSRIFDLIHEESPPGVCTIWREYISEPENYEVHLLKQAGDDELSEVEEDLIGEIFREYGYKSGWELRDYCHALPEWQDPNGSAIPIQISDILRAGKKTEAEIVAVEDELESLTAVQLLVAPTNDALR